MKLISMSYVSYNTFTYNKFIARHPKITRLVKPFKENVTD